MKKAAAVLFLIVMPLLFCFSCSGEKTADLDRKTLVVAYINTDELLIKWEKYRYLGDEYIKQRDKLARDLKDKNKALAEKTSISDEDKKSFMILRNQYNELISQWAAKKRTIVEEIRSVASEVIEAKNIDVVLDNCESSPVIEYGGTDITLDVLAKLKEKSDMAAGSAK